MNDELIELPEGWEWTNLGELVLNIQYGYTASATDEPTKIKFLRITDLQENSVDWETVPFCDCSEIDKYKLFPGDIVVARTGATTGKSFLLKQIPGTTIFASYLIRLHTSNLCPPEYLALFMQSPKYWRQITTVSKGTAQPGANASILSKLIIPLPPLNEQKRIVAKIEELTDRSQTAQKALEAIPQLCDRFRKSVLTAAFRGDLTADWREQNPDVEPALKLFVNIMNDRQQKYNKECEELLLEGKKPPKLTKFEVTAINCDVPETWITIFVESACLFIIDCLHSTPKFVDDGEYCIDTTCIEPCKINWNQARKVSYEDFLTRTSRMIPKENDILFSREGTIGTVVKVPNSPKLCLGQRMMMFRFSPYILPEYAEFYLQSPIFKQQYKPLILGSTSPHLNIGDIRRLGFIVPPLAEQIEIVKCVKSVLKIIDNIEKQYQQAKEKLDQLNQSILSKAFRGELVPQDPNDEPASKLLERIKTEREKINNNKPKSQRKTKTPAKQGTIPGMESQFPVS